MCTKNMKVDSKIVIVLKLVAKWIILMERNYNQCKSVENNRN